MKLRVLVEQKQLRLLQLQRRLRGEMLHDSGWPRVAGQSVPALSADAQQQPCQGGQQPIINQLSGVDPPEALAAASSGVVVIDMVLESEASSRSAAAAAAAAAATTVAAGAGAAAGAWLVPNNSSVGTVLLDWSRMRRARPGSLPFLKSEEEAPPLYKPLAPKPFVPLERQPIQEESLKSVRLKCPFITIMLSWVVVLSMTQSPCCKPCANPPVPRNQVKLRRWTSTACTFRAYRPLPEQAQAQRAKTSTLKPCVQDETNG